MGAAAFWIALAAVIISGRWFKSRSEAMKHETIRLVIEKTGQIDEVKLKELFEPPPPPPLPPHWFRGPEPGANYTAMRVIGTLVLFVAFGIVVCFSIFYLGDAASQSDLSIGLGIAAVVALLGAGLLYASRYAVPPRAPLE